jgi:hypothetical protein
VKGRILHHYWKAKMKGKKGSERMNPILVDGTVYISDIEKSRLGG